MILFNNDTVWFKCLQFMFTSILCDDSGVTPVSFEGLNTKRTLAWTSCSQSFLGLWRTDPFLMSVQLFMMQCYLNEVIIAQGVCKEPFA